MFFRLCLSECYNTSCGLLFLLCFNCVIRTMRQQQFFSEKRLFIRHYASSRVESRDQENNFVSVEKLCVASRCKVYGKYSCVTSTSMKVQLRRRVRNELTRYFVTNTMRVPFVTTNTKIQSRRQARYGTRNKEVLHVVLKRKNILPNCYAWH